MPQKTNSENLCAANGERNIVIKPSFLEAQKRSKKTLSSFRWLVPQSLRTQPKCLLGYINKGNLFEFPLLMSGLSQFSTPSILAVFPPLARRPLCRSTSHQPINGVLTAYNYLPIDERKRPCIIFAAIFQQTIPLKTKFV